MYCIYLVIMQQVDGHILVPKVLGSAVGISGLTALFAIVVGGGLFGIPGMVLGVPAVTVLIDIVKKVWTFRKEKKQKLEEESHSEEVEP
jgi:predicted PurR-regulated permease PerM